jgi:general stress protein YciG
LDIDTAKKGCFSRRWMRRGDASNRGFASMDDNKQREIASKGGQASGGNFKNDLERASEAGKKGGENSNGGNR